MSKYGRELDLILLLTENKGYTTIELANKLGITRRSLYYYLDYFRMSGFKVLKHGNIYRLDRNTDFFRRLHDNIVLTEAEATFVYKALLENYPKHTVATMARNKLAHYYQISYGEETPLGQRVIQHSQLIREAIRNQKIVILKNYASAHSSTVSDRLVEPFSILNDMGDVRCFDLKSHSNKTFKLARAESVELTDVEWLHTDKHAEVYTDIFLFSGETRYPITLRMGLLARNLMDEEFPQSYTCFTPDTDGKWLFKTEVVSFVGIGRFVLGLYDDIEIIDSPAFESYIREKVARIRNRLNTTK